MADLRHNARVVAGCCVFGGLVSIGFGGMFYVFVEHAAPAGPFPGVFDAAGGMAFATGMMILGSELGGLIMPKEVGA